MSTLEKDQFLRAQLESLLFAAGKPLSIKKLAEILSVPATEIEAVASDLELIYRQHHHGLEVIRHQGEIVMATRPEHSKLVKDFIKAEELGDLTKPQLEALSVLAYRGPLSKAELEQIRGVNCSLILRNLMIRGLVEAVDQGNQTRYQVTVDFLRYLGITSISELPDYQNLSQDENLNQVLSAIDDSQPTVSQQSQSG